ncbi:MAG: thioredoxin domain-containing protein [Myxococcota bacterium]
MSFGGLLSWAQVKQDKETKRPSSLFDELLGKKKKAKKRTSPVVVRAKKKASVRHVPGLAIGGSPAWGPKGAPVTIIVFSDFQCPYCARFSATIRRIRAHYPSKVRVVFKHHPLSFHKRALPAAVAAMAAHRQGRFWAYHDRLFANIKKLNDQDLLDHARALALNMESFRADLQDPTIKLLIRNDQRMVKRVGVRGTPNSFVNGFPVLGAQPFERLKHVIDKVLRGEHNPSSKAGTRVRKPAVEAKPQRIVLGNAPTIGPLDAPIVIVSFLDFQCPFCVRSARMIPKLMKKYPGKIRWVWKHYPLPFHKRAMPAAIASMAAHDQGMFWPYVRRLFRAYRSLSDRNLNRFARALDLEMDVFWKARASSHWKAWVERDIRQAKRLGVKGTPTSFVNGYKIVGAQPMARFEALIAKVSAKRAHAPQERPKPEVLERAVPSRKSP